jgi:hypothetical protein
MASVLRIGIDGSLGNSPTVDATLLGQTLNFSAGGKDNAVSGFIGLDGQYTLANGWQIESTMEAGLGTDNSITTEGRIGLNISL